VGPIFRLATSMYVTCMLLINKKLNCYSGIFLATLLAKERGFRKIE
jgi:hypothetical protein